MRLYEISNTYLEFMQAVEAGEIPDEAIADTLESINGEFENKADNIACVIKSLLADAEAIKAEEKILKERRETKQRHVDSLKHYLSESMKHTGKSKIETARNCLSFRKSTSLSIIDEESFKKKHRDLCKIEEKVTIPKSDITKLIKSGQEITGAELVEKQNLQIK